MLEMARQHEEITADIRRMEEEEEAKRREREIEEEEVRNITARLIQLGHVPPPVRAVSVDEGECEGEGDGEDELEDEADSETESKPTLHVPVGFYSHTIFFFH